jgi:predicted N-acetyltransferase YhbS
MLQIRPARKSEIPTVSNIASNAFWNHPDVARYYPKRVKHPEAFVHSYERMLEEHLYSAGALLLVAVQVPETTADANTAEAIVGFAAWQRYGDTPCAEEWKKRSLGTRVFSALLTMRDIVVIDRSYLGPLQRWKLERKSPETEEDMGDGQVKETDDHWCLHVLGVHSEWQGKGVGTALLNWGVKEATREQVPVLLWASVSVERFYRNHGFMPIKKVLRDGQDVEYLMAKLSTRMADRVGEGTRGLR